MSPVIEAVFRALGLMLVAYAFGATFGLGELLAKRYRWFGGAQWAVGGAVALFGAGMLWLGHAPMHLLWLAALGGWIVRGKLGARHLPMVLGMASYLWFWGPRAAHYPWEITYFAIVLVVLGFGHDLSRRRTTPRAVDWFFARRKLHWYLLAAGYCLLFEIDSMLVLSVYGFAEGSALLEDDARRTKLERLGIRKVA